jgi:hypothetical protein
MVLFARTRLGSNRAAPTIPRAIRAQTVLTVVYAILCAVELESFAKLEYVRTLRHIEDCL